MARAPQHPSQEGQKPIAERVSDVFSVYLVDISDMATAKRITTTDRQLYEKAYRAFEDVRRTVGPDLDEGSVTKLAMLADAFKDAKGPVYDAAKFVGDGTVTVKAEKKEKLTKKEKRDQRLAREALGETALEPAAEESEGVGGELTIMASLEQTADQWGRGLNEFERRLVHFDRWFFTFRDQGHAIAVADELVSDIGGLGDDIIGVLTSLGIQLETIDDVPGKLRESVNRYNVAMEAALVNQERAKRFDELVAERKQELEKKGTRRGADCEGIY